MTGRVRARSDLHAVALDDEVLIWDEAREHLHRLNPAAARVWDALGDWRSVGEVAALVAGDRAAAVVSDVGACIDDLAAMGLVDVAPD